METVTEWIDRNGGWNRLANVEFSAISGKKRPKRYTYRLVFAKNECFGPDYGALMKYGPPGFAFTVSTSELTRPKEIGTRYTNGPYQPAPK